MAQNILKKIIKGPLIWAKEQDSIMNCTKILFLLAHENKTLHKQKLHKVLIFNKHWPLLGCKAFLKSFMEIEQQIVKSSNLIKKVFSQPVTCKYKYGYCHLSHTSIYAHG